MKPWITVMMLFLTGNVLAADANGPIMRLFPTTVLEDIRETGKAAEKMEDNLQDVIARLDLQQQLYQEALCSGADEDPGCDRIARQLGATYLEMLSAMEERLPAMEEAVNNTRNSLAKRLKQELGEKSTPNGLQNLLLGRIEKLPADTDAATLRGKSGIRLSNRFKQYYKLVATRNGNASQSLAVVAADIYLDMQEASHLIATTREEISRAALMEQLNQSFGQITPEMGEIVADVKTILFGEADMAAPISAAPNRNVSTAFISPLEF